MTKMPKVSTLALAALPFVLALLIYGKYGGAAMSWLPDAPAATTKGS